jgi:hypothetical protein
MQDDMMLEGGAGAPVHTCYGFKAAAWNLKLSLGYNTYEDGRVLLYCFEQIAAQPLQVWRCFWTSAQGALQAAEDLCKDAEQYLNGFSTARRPTEDLGLDDYLKHIQSRLHNEFQ